MSKKKNTLKDLDEFLKQQAATLVTPEKLSDKIETKVEPPAERSENTSQLTTAIEGKRNVTLEVITGDLHALAKEHDLSVREQLYNVILHVVEETGDFTPEDRMLINTVLYLKHGENWKQAIREYWKSHH